MDSEGGTPPNTPPPRRQKRNKRRTRKSSSSSDESLQKRRRRSSSRMDGDEVLRLLSSWKKDASKTTVFNSNNLNNAIPEFDPANRSQTTETWLRKVNECATIYGWEKAQIIHF